MNQATCVTLHTMAVNPTSVTAFGAIVNGASDAANVHQCERTCLEMGERSMDEYVYSLRRVRRSCVRYAPVAGIVVTVQR